MNNFDAADTQVETDYDRVQADAVIDAPLENVWELVSEPGWWINDGPLADHDVTFEDGLYRVSDPDAGEWFVEKADEDPMDVVSFRWNPLNSEEWLDEQVTLVELSLSEEGGRTALHVEESGIAALTDDEESARQIWDDEAGMWEEILAQAKKHLEN